MRADSFALLAAGLAILAASPAGGQEIRWRVEPGERLQYVIKDEAKETKLFREKRGTDNFRKAYSITMKVKAANKDGTFDIVQTIDRVETRRQHPELGVKSYDSESDDEGGNGLELLAKAELTYTIGKDGKATQLKAAPATSAKWTNLSRSQMAVVSPANLATLVPLAPLPTPAKDETGKSKALRGMVWKETFQADDGGELGRRDVKATYEYFGAETRRGQDFERIDVFYESKASSAKPKFEIASSDARGSISFDAVNGHLSLASMAENYRFVPTGEDASPKKDEDEDFGVGKKKKKKEDKPKDKSVEIEKVREIRFVGRTKGDEPSN